MKKYNNNNKFNILQIYYNYIIIYYIYYKNYEYSIYI